MFRRETPLFPPRQAYTPEQIGEVLGRTSGHSCGGMGNRRGLSLCYTLSILSTRLATLASRSHAQGPEHYTTFFLNRRREGLLVTSPWIVTKTEKAKKKKTVKKNLNNLKSRNSQSIGKQNQIYLFICLLVC